MTATLAAKALRYLEIVTANARAAGLPGVDRAAWDELARLVATDAFLLVGRGKQQLDWAGTVAAMDRWARETEFSAEVRRLDEAGSLVFMELDERSTSNGESALLNTMTVFEFDRAGRLCRLDCFG